MKERISTRIEYDINRQELARYVCQVINYDLHDRVCDDTFFDSGGDVIRRIIYRYSKNDQVSERFEYDSLDELVERHQYFEDENGEVIKSVFEFENGRKTIREFAFTELGLADKAVITDESGLLTGFETWVFDPDGRIVSEIETDADNAEISRYDKQYGDHGHLVEETRFINGELYSVETFSYNEQLQITYEMMVGTNGDQWHCCTTEYDHIGNVVRKHSVNPVQETDDLETFDYDSANNMILHRMFSNGRLVFENKCGYSLTNFLETEEIMEVDHVGRISRHEKLVHQEHQ
jgi:hypothetical protein